MASVGTVPEIPEFLSDQRNLWLAPKGDGEACLAGGGQGTAV